MNHLNFSESKISHSLKGESHIYIGVTTIKSKIDCDIHKNTIHVLKSFNILGLSRLITCFLCFILNIVLEKNHSDRNGPVEVGIQEGSSDPSSTTDLLH